MVMPGRVRPSSGPINMDDALFARVDVKERDGKVATVLPQDLDLLAAIDRRSPQIDP